MTESELQATTNAVDQALGNLGFKAKAETAASAATPAATQTETKVIPTPVAATPAPTTLVEAIKQQRAEVLGEVKTPVVTETAAVETTAAIKEEVKIPEPLPVDETKLLSGMLGGRFKNLKEVSDAYTDLETKSKVDPFVNPVVKGLNDFVKGGGDPDVYMTLQKLNLDKMTPRDRVVHQLMLQKGYEKADAELLVDSKYKIGAPLQDEDGVAIPGVREAQLELKGADHDAKAFLTGYKAENLIAPADKQLQESIKAWEGTAPDVIRELDHFTIKLGDETHKVPISEDARLNSMKSMEAMVKNGVLDLDLTTREGREEATRIAINMAKAQDFDAAIQQVGDLIKTEELKKKHNTRLPTGDALPPKVVKDRDQMLFDILSGNATR